MANNRLDVVIFGASGFSELFSNEFLFECFCKLFHHMSIELLQPVSILFSKVSNCSRACHGALLAVTKKN